MTKKTGQEEISEEVTTSWDGEDESESAMRFGRDSKPKRGNRPVESRKGGQRGFEAMRWEAGSGDWQEMMLECRASGSQFVPGLLNHSKEF